MAKKKESTTYVTNEEILLQLLKEFREFVALIKRNYNIK